MEFIINLPEDYFNEVDNKLKLLNSKRPLSNATLNSLKECNILDFTYHSNAIEGNTLTLREIKVVLEGITIGGKSVVEHLEVINHKAATLLHGEFVFIHPFIDGNGRTARLLMNFEAMKYGYLPIIIRKESRLKYYDALENAAIEHDYTDFIILIVDEEIKMLDEYLNLIG